MNTAMDDRQEIETLLPWFVTGKLDAPDRQRVERYLRDHPDMQRQVALAREEIAETVAGAEGFGMPSRASFDKLMTQVAAQPRRRAGVRETVTPYFERIADWITGLSRPQIGAMAAAAALVVAVQGASLVYLATGSSPSHTYQTASGGSDAKADQGTFALVSFRPTATAAEVTAALAELNVQIVAGPRAGGVWRVRLSPEALAEDQAEARLAALRARTTVVGFVSLAQ
jgi:anti-sigma factor RsiW